MKPAALGLALLALASILSACSDTRALLYCLAVDHDINRKCQ